MTETSLSELRADIGNKITALQNLLHAIDDVEKYCGGVDEIRDPGPVRVERPKPEGRQAAQKSPQKKSKTWMNKTTTVAVQKQRDACLKVLRKHGKPMSQTKCLKAAGIKPPKANVFNGPEFQKGKGGANYGKVWFAGEDFPRDRTSPAGESPPRKRSAGAGPKSGKWAAAKGEALEILRAEGPMQRTALLKRVGVPRGGITAFFRQPEFVKLDDGRAWLAGEPEPAQTDGQVEEQPARRERRAKAEPQEPPPIDLDDKVLAPDGKRVTIRQCVRDFMQEYGKGIRPKMLADILGLERDTVTTALRDPDYVETPTGFKLKVSHG